jgi:DNA-binding transcriptional LysR family regulator
MHFRDLNYFIALAETLDPNEAARRIGVGRPALVAAVRRLESEVGGPLVEKRLSELRLTPLGVQLLAHAPRLLAMRDQAVRAVRQAGDASPGGPDGSEDA